MVIDVGPDHQHDCQTVRLAAIFPTIGAQTGDHAAAGDRGGRVPTAPARQSIAHVGSIVAGEAVAVVVRHVSGVVEEACVRLEIVGTTRPPCLVFLRLGSVGHIYGDLGFLDAFMINGGGGFARTAQCGYVRYAMRDNLLHLVNDASTLTISSLDQPVGGRIPLSLRTT